jgi:hypothetical protein
MISWLMAFLSTLLYAVCRVDKIPVDELKFGGGGGRLHLMIEKITISRDEPQRELSLSLSSPSRIFTQSVIDARVFVAPTAEGKQAIEEHPLFMMKKLRPEGKDRESRPQNQYSYIPNPPLNEVALSKIERTSVSGDTVH